MKFTVWGRELQWRTSGRESISFPTVSIERSKKRRERKNKTKEKHVANMMTVIQTLSPFFLPHQTLSCIYFENEPPSTTYQRNAHGPRLGF